MSGAICNLLLASKYQSFSGERRKADLKTLQEKIVAVVKKGENFNPQYYSGSPQSLIIIAFESYQYEIAEWMLENYIEKIDASQESQELSNIFDYLIGQFDYGLIESLLEKKSQFIKVNKRTESRPPYLHQLVVQSDLSSVGVKDNVIPIHRPPTETVAALLKYGADINIQDGSNQTPLMKAVIEGKLAMIEFLLQNEANPNLQDKEGNTALHYAVKSMGTQYGQSHHKKIIKLLLGHGADINIPDVLKQTPLMKAVIEGKLAMIEFLLQNEANPNLQDKEGNTALHSATRTRYYDVKSLGTQYGQSHNEEIIKLLLGHGADSAIKNNSKVTPFGLTIQYQNFPLSISRGVGYDVIKMLIENSHVNLNVQNHKGNTALHVAVQAKDIKLFEILIETQRVDVIKNHDEETPFDIAGSEEPELYPDYEGARSHNLFLEQAHHLVARFGNLPILKHILQSIKKFPDGIRILLESTALTVAASNGHLPIVKHIVDQKDGALEKMKIIDSNDYRLLKCALSGLKHDLSTASGNDKLTAAVKERYNNLLHYLLDNGSDKQFSWVLDHDHDYGEVFLHDYIEEKLKEFGNVPLPLFGLTLTFTEGFIRNRQVNRGLDILRNLVRRGGIDCPEDERNALTKGIEQLLAVDAIKNRCHGPLEGDLDVNGNAATTAAEDGANAARDEQGVGEGGESDREEEAVNNRSNKILKLAVSVGNSYAVCRLLLIDDVRKIAQNEETNGPQRVSTYREDSVKALDAVENDLVKRVKQHYMPNEVSVDDVMNSLRKHLEKLYEKNPIVIYLEGRESIKLPFDLTELKEFKLTDDELQEVHKAYCYPPQKGQERKIPYHTAYRYLLKPNPLMHKKALWVRREGSDTPCSYFEEYQVLIASLYLAAVDDKLPPQDGFNAETRFELFVNELALLGRAHNYDTKSDTNGKAIDDLEPDKPSCSSGTVRRLVQSILGHGMFKVATATTDIIKQSVNEFVHEKFVAKFPTHKQKKSTKNAFDKIIYEENHGMTKEKAFNLLSQFNITDEERNELVTRILKAFPTSIVSEVLRIQCIVDDLLNVRPELNQGCHAVIFGEILHGIYARQPIDLDADDSDDDDLNTDDNELMKVFKTTYDEKVSSYKLGYFKENYSDIDQLCKGLEATRNTAKNTTPLFSLFSFTGGHARWQAVTKLTGVTPHHEGDLKTILLAGYKDKIEAKRSDAHDGAGGGYTVSVP